ncbi:unnamed protein product [Periconia digitata]|uniref:Hcy-binding domain-containing protein n=1 Tax=Periconia digitata TaxID=1303443 RepID=A0A9W4UM80_9PLEO|nr:unnamed protein product [Periconia digitata]
MSTQKPASKLSSIIATNKPIVLDGALATYLEILGADISTALWSATLLTTAPHLITRAHYDYFAAGASIAITASYQAGIPGLVQHLNIDEASARDLVKKSVELAGEARHQFLTTSSEAGNERGRDLLIAGSVGPYGAYLANGSEYTGSYSATMTASSLKDFHRGRVAALIEAGVDCLAIETIPSYVETVALCELLREEFAGVEAWFAFTLYQQSPEEIEREGDGGPRIPDGTPMADVLALLEKEDSVVAVGVNCVAEEVAMEALEGMKGLTKKPFVVYPNSGEVWDAVGRKWDGERKGGDGLVARTKGFWEIGARILGGCCRSTPEDISVIAKIMEGLQEI